MAANVGQSGFRRFSYRRNNTKLYMAVVLAGLILGLIVWPIVAHSPGWYPGVFEISFPIVIVVLAGSTNFYFVNSDIEIDDDMICWVLFGWQWKRIRWDDIERIEVMPFFDYENRRKLKMFCMQRKNRSRLYFLPRGSIFFNEKIHSCSVLLELVRIQVARYRIPVRRGDLVTSEISR